MNCMAKLNEEKVRSTILAMVFQSATAGRV
jgi:hypothetical protein